jgi:hypothetical protein
MDSNAVTGTDPGPGPRPRAATPADLYIVIILIGVAGFLIKQPFGHYLLQVMGKHPGGPPHISVGWFLTRAEGPVGSVVIIALGCLLHARSGLPAPPAIERLLFRSARVGPRPAIWRPGLLGALVCTAIGAVLRVVNHLRGAHVPLAAKVGTHAIPHDQLLHLTAVWPLGSIGAALSGETIFRFGLLSVLMGLMSFARIGGSKPNNATAFWIGNISFRPPGSATRTSPGASWRPNRAVPRSRSCAPLRPGWGSFSDTSSAVGALRPRSSPTR